MKSLKFVVLTALMLCVFGMSQSAFGFFHYRAWGAPYWGGPYWGYPAYSYGWYGDCCAPVVEPCCAPVAAAPVVAAPVVSTPVAAVADCCGPVVSYGYPASYYLGWRPGPIRRLLFGRYRWYATGYWGGYYYTPDCCDPVYDAAPIESAPAAAPAPTPAPVAPTPAPAPAAETSSILSPSGIYHQTSYTMPEATHENSGIVSISVPEDAVVYVNDVRTNATGTNRSFVSFGLKSGNEYDYVIRAEVTRNGQTYVETKVVTLKAGQKDAVAFSFPQLVNSVDQVVAL